MNSTHLPVECHKDLLDALNSLTTFALIRGREADATLMLEAVRAWRADADAVCVHDAWIAMRNEDFPTARRLLMELNDRGTGAMGSTWTALLATCLYLQNDPSWRGYADAVIAEDKSEIAVQFSQLLCDSGE
jgi:hypothetical protein